MARKKQIRHIPTSHLVRQAQELKVFDGVFYEYREGQPGVWVCIRRGRLNASLKRESHPCEEGEGYGATRGLPKKITYLNIYKQYLRPRREEHLGTWDSQEHPRKKHTFEKQAEQDIELKDFLEDILTLFNH